MDRHEFVDCRASNEAVFFSRFAENLKPMKKLLYIVLIMSCTSCATILSRGVDDCQRCMPKEGENKRKLNYWYLAGDITIIVIGGFTPLPFATSIPLLYDLATNKIYKKCPRKPAPTPTP